MWCCCQVATVVDALLLLVRYSCQCVTVVDVFAAVDSLLLAISCYDKWVAVIDILQLLTRSQVSEQNVEYSVHLISSRLNDASSPHEGNSVTDIYSHL